MNEVIVEYDYTAKESDELTIKKGDIIKDVVKKPGGWWEGVLKEKKGMFPDNFVRPLDKDGVVFRNSKDVCRIKQCRVVFSYNQDHEDELNLKVGDVIDIIGEEEEGWWRGTLNGKEGVFPSNFVKEISFQPSPPKRVSYVPNENDAKPPKLPAKPTKQLCEATYPYKAQNEDEISFKEGDIITLISKDSQDPGWWQGELNGKTGFFPDNFVVLISSDNKSSSKEEKKTHSKAFPDTGAIKSVASQRKSLEPKSEKIDKSDSPSPGDSIHNKTPPVPSKKPVVSIKKSPSGSGTGFISEIKKKIVDVVDGTASSRMTMHKEKEVVVENTENAFDQVERRPLLGDVRAGRVKAPGRRPPTTIMHKDDSTTMSNGNIVEANHHDSQMIDNEVKPRHKNKGSPPPWLEEMKQNQVKRTMMTSMEGQPGEVEGTPEKEKELDSPNSMSPIHPKLKTPTEPHRPEKGPPPPRPTTTHITKDIPPTPSQPIVIPKEPIPPKISPMKPVPSPSSGSIRVVTTADILERLEALEEAVRKQNQTIEGLRNQLLVETEMRMLLQEKVMQNVQV
ncbi:CD2-associated protein [Diabrotica virgifera virgifera]|uniref:SH3 domain-containing protein n=1 Tax=Diabrotica virgifera virgifera TaxID=50390 RepID=A0ABM5ID02_DIAVI|nr:CD2-associated protein [Diabrotica virgifera virgifera]